MTGLRRISYVSLPLEMLARGVAALLYRVTARGAERVPASGPVLIVANHLSYVDVVALQLASPRPLRFVAYRGPETNAFFEWVFRRAGVIVLSSGHAGGAIRAAIAALKRGEAVCLFPEGMISRTGQLMRIERGFSFIARKAGAPVVPAAIDGLWGSMFSFSENRYVWKRPRLGRTDVRVHFGAPLPPAAADPARVRGLLLELWADAFSERPSLERSLGWTCARALAKRPGRVVVVDRTGDRREVRAAALFAAAAALARHLRRTVPEARVGIVLPPGAGALVANLAVAWADKTPVNLNFTAPRDAAQRAIALAGVRTVLSADALRERAPQFPWPEGTLDLRAALAAAKGRLGFAPWFLAAWLLPAAAAPAVVGVSREGGDREAALLFTSGSGGPPKGVVLTHRNLLANCQQFSSLGVVPRCAVLLGCLPVFHSFGFTITVWFPLLLGRKLVTVPSPLETRRIVEAIRDEHATTLVAAPTFLRPILKKAEPRELRSLEVVVAGAERLPPDLREGFRRRFQLEILEGYGLTEASPVTNVNQPAPPITTATAGPQEANRPGTVGRLLPGLAAKVVDPDSGAELSPGAVGLIAFRGPNVFAGYIDASGTLAPARVDGWYVTGDLGYFDEDGFLTIAGRRSRFSKIGGEMVPHGEIEQILAASFAVDPAEPPAFAVGGVTDPAKGEALVLLTTRGVTADEVRERLSAAGLPNLWIPRRIRHVDAIPLLPTGKLDLGRIAALAAEA